MWHWLSSAPSSLLPSLGRRQCNFNFVLARHAKYPVVEGGHQYLGSDTVTLHQSLVGFSILPRHPSLFHCAASLLWLSASLVFFFLLRIFMAQANAGGKLLGVAIWILEAIPGCIKMLTLAKSLVSLCYQADEVGKGCRHRGDPGGWAFRSAGTSRSSQAWLRWGMVVKIIRGWAK